MATAQALPQQDLNAGAYMPLPVAVAVAAPLSGPSPAPCQEQKPRSAPSANIAALNAARAMAAQRSAAESPRRQSGHSEAAYSPRRQSGQPPAPAGGNAAALAAARSLAAQRDGGGAATPRSDALAAARALGAARTGRNSPDRSASYGDGRGGGGGGGGGGGSSGGRRDSGQAYPQRRADRPRSPPRGEASTPRGDGGTPRGGPVDALAAARALAAQRGGGSTPRAPLVRVRVRANPHPHPNPNPNPNPDQAGRARHRGRVGLAGLLRPAARVPAVAMASRGSARHRRCGAGCAPKCAAARQPRSGTQRGGHRRSGGWRGRRRSCRTTSWKGVTTGWPSCRRH